jgi:glycosyltransferase involved in cell wall biosynthesis
MNALARRSQGGAAEPLFSIVISTYNRSYLLAQALESIVCQTLHPANYEIVVVNNASTDDTDDVVEGVASRYPDHTIVLIHEERPGLSRARNAGLRSARGVYVAYIDDDAQAETGWLQRALEWFAHARPSPQVVGGPIRPLYDAPKPPWFQDKYETRTWGDAARSLQRGESFSGSNMIWNRAVIERVGGFNPSLGMKGRELSVGEESAAFDRLWRLVEQPVLWYDPDLIVYHWTDPNKMRPAYYLQRAFAAGQASVPRRREVLGRWGTAYLIVRAVAGIVVRSVEACARLAKRPRIPNWLVEDVSPVAGHCGALVAAWGIEIHLMQQSSQRTGSGASRSL